MKTKIKTGIYILVLGAALFTSGCKKYLDEKSDKKLLIPSSLTELQSLLDNYSTMNNSYCAGGEVSADNYYLTDADYDALSNDYDKGMYVWAKSNLFAIGTDGNDWSNCYKAIYVSNSVLDYLDKFGSTSSSLPTWNSLRGQALLFRGSRYLDAALIWTLAYDPATASSDLGLPIRLGTDFNQGSIRSSVQQTYGQIIADLKAAIALLPKTQTTVNRPSKPAAYGLLARTYLSMRDYPNARLYADSCLQLSNNLMDYNSLDATLSYPIKQFNSEALFNSTLTVAYQLLYSAPKMNPDLYNSYSVNDLRKTVFFLDNGDGTYSFKGNYTGDYGLDSSPTTDEMYLIRAEGFARQGKISEAMKDLNDLLVKRWKTDPVTGKTLYVDQTATDEKDALNKILVERRKELLFRGLRWMDIKRLNKEGANISLSRTVHGQTYSLPANDLRFALPIPEDVIAASGMQQNLR